jgi:hypothetical protein
MSLVTLVVCAAVFASMLPLARGVTAQEPEGAPRSR